jgi:cold shock CspA family protein
LNRGVKVLAADSLECFERMGDREPDHSKALDFYAKALPTGRFWAGLSLKTWGATSLCGLSDRLNSMLWSFDARRYGHLIYKVYYYSAARRGKPSPHEVLRIREGMKAFERYYGTDPRLKATKAAFNRDYGRVPIRYCLEKMGPLVRGVVTHLKKDQQHVFLLCDNGRRYRFPAFQLASGLAYGDLFEGMELDFQVLKEGTEGEIGEAVNVRKPVRPGESPVQSGRVSSLDKEGSCGLISSGGKEYHFHASNLREGLAYDEIWEGTWLEFQIDTGRPQSESGEAINIGRIEDYEADDSTIFRGTYRSRGTVYELRPLGSHGFIVSGGRDYYFHASYLTSGLKYDDIYEGIEIEFDIAKESTAIRCGQAKRIRNILGQDGGDMAEAGSSGDHNDGSGEKPARVAHEIPTRLTRKGKVAPFKGEGRYGFISAGGTEYYFKESDLRGGLTFRNVYEGMEVEFQVAREGRPGTTGMAVNVHPANDLTHEPLPVRRGVVYCLVPKLECGFISALDGKEYQFAGFDLREGLKYEDIHEGTEVTFQVMKEPDTKAGKAMNVRLRKD